MDPKQLAKQMVDFNKTAFDNSFNTMSTIQDQTEKMFTSMMEQMVFFPEEGKKWSMSGSRPTKKGVKISRPRPMKISKKWKLSFLPNNHTIC